MRTERMEYCMNAMKQLWRFGIEQALSCIFPVIIFVTLALSKIITIPGLARYDFILIICLIAQVMMVWTRLETKDELKVICVFHLIGLGLELYKVNMGSWSYPEEALSKIGGVPLYSGFMYASVASYICQAWRRFDLSIANWPHPVFAFGLSVLIYLNFFTHHYIVDLRWYLTALLFIVFWKTWVSYKVGNRIYRMPMILSFLLIGWFIWIAENISTFLGAWKYPDQEHKWQIVHLGKISSWFLLVVISVIIVAQLKAVKQSKEQGPSNHIEHS